MKSFFLLLLYTWFFIPFAWAQSSQPSSQPISQPSSQPASLPKSLPIVLPEQTPEKLEALKEELQTLEAKLKTSQEEQSEADDRIEELEVLVESLSSHIARIDEAMAQGQGVLPEETKTPQGEIDRTKGSTLSPDWTWRVGKSSLGLGGYIDWKYAVPIDDDPETNSAFTVPRFILFVHSTVSERISFSTEIEIENVGVNTNDNFRFQGEVVLEFAAMDIKIHDALTLRTGVILVPMGKFNLVHDAPIQDFSERPLVDTFLLPSTWFEPGVGILGETLLGDTALLRYELYAIQGLTDNISAGAGLRGARAPMSFDINRNKGLVGRVALEPYLGLEIGFSSYMGLYDTQNIRSIGIVALDATWRKGPFELVGEATQIMIEPGLNQQNELIPTSMRGFFLEGHYHLFADFLRKYKGLRLPHFTLMGRLDYVDTDSAKGIDDRLRLSSGINFRPVEDFVIKFEHHRDLEGLKNREKNDLFVVSTALSF